MRYPKVGELFYWKGCDGDIYQDTCFKIVKKPGVMCQYFNYLSENGGGRSPETFDDDRGRPLWNLEVLYRHTDEGLGRSWRPDACRVRHDPLQMGRP